MHLNYVLGVCIAGLTLATTDSDPVAEPGRTAHVTKTVAVTPTAKIPTSNV
jgi:hypothetical protein